MGLVNHQTSTEIRLTTEAADCSTLDSQPPTRSSRILRSNIFGASSITCPDKQGITMHDNRTDHTSKQPIARAAAYTQVY